MTFPITNHRRESLFGCGRLEEPLYLVLHGSPGGFDDFQSPTIAESRFFAKSNSMD
jgi:hypothetical protein